MNAKELIVNGKAALGIEFGSTRIKAVLIGENHETLALGTHDWENRLVDGIWTYTLEDIWGGLQDCYASLAADVKAKYDAEITKLSAIGFSAMMHGYLAFDKDDNLLVPFRTWRNTITAQSSGILTEKLGFNIPQRWSIAHLYQAILNGEEHILLVAVQNQEEDGLGGSYVCVVRVSVLSEVLRLETVAHKLTLKEHLLTSSCLGNYLAVDLGGLIHRIVEAVYGILVDVLAVGITEPVFVLFKYELFVCFKAC